MVVGLASIMPGASGAPLMDEPGYSNEYRSFYLGQVAGLDELRTCDLDWAYMAPAGDFGHDGTRIGRHGAPNMATRPAGSRTLTSRSRCSMRSRRPPPPHRHQRPGGVMSEVHDSMSEVHRQPERLGRRLFKATDGRPRSGVNDLLLTTRGSNSGELRRTALVYERDGDRYVLAASNRSADHHPACYLNLLAEPRVTVRVDTETFAARARPVTAAERPYLWRLMVSTTSRTRSSGLASQTSMRCGKGGFPVPAPA